MGDRMTPMPFPQLVEWVMKEHDDKGTVFGVYRPYQAKAENDRKIFGRTLETPVGPAAGPSYPADPEYCSGLLCGKPVL